MRRFLLVGGVIFYISILTVNAQLQYIPQNQYKFKYLTIDQGLSNNQVRSICQDLKGFIWIATDNGLNKYNGQTVVTYKYDANDITTVSSNIINTIFIDSRNNLWIGGDGGLDRYNADFNNFIRFRHKDITWPLGEVLAITEDKNGRLWFAGTTGLYSYHFQTSEIWHLSNETGNSYGIPSGSNSNLMIDKNNQVWFSIADEGLCLFIQDDTSFYIFENIPDDITTVSSNSITDLYEDNNGNIWAGTFNNGLNLYVPESNSFRRFIPDPDNNYSTRVRDMFEDLEGNFFIGTRAGLYLYNNRTNEFVLYANEDHNFSKLSQNSVVTSFIDKSGTLWIGTFSGGVNYTNLNRKEFIHYIAGKQNNQYLSGSNIYAITEDSKGNLWIGGDNGINYLDRTTYTYTYYTNDPENPYSLSYNDVKDFEWDNKGNLWIATNRGGLNYLDIRTGKFTSFTHDPDNPNSIAGDKIYCLLNDKYDNLWIQLSPTSSFDSIYIDILPDGSDKFIHLNETGYFGFEQNKDGDVYVGGVNGFWIFTREDSIFEFIPNEKCIYEVNVITKDSYDRLWIGSKKGLARYNLEDQSFLWYSEDTGYPIGEVFGILEDDSNNLWVSTMSGLLRIANAIKDTSKIQIRVYDQYDGLQSRQFNFNAYYKCRSGEMVFGGVNGFNSFFPEKIVENSVLAEVVLTELKVNNTTVPIGKKVDGRVILEKSISVTDEITLGPKHNIFTLEFASFQSINPEKYAYRIKLEGLDEEWQYRKANRNFVTYTNLSPGEYTFYVSAANNDGYWNEEPVELKINVIPVFYKTGWFIITAILGFIGIVLAVYFYRIRLIRMQNIALERIVKERTREISEQKEEIISQNDELEQHRNNLRELVKERTNKLEHALEKAKESDALKSAFLANISHEIRTPMNAIMGFSNLLNDEDYNTEERAEFTKQIQLNSTGLLKIIDEILDLSLIESNQLNIINEIIELNVLLDHLYSYYYLNNKDSKVKLRKNNTLHSLNLRLNSDGVRIRQILTNLMDNAFKYTEEGYIELGVYEDDGKLCMYVKDTGKGIPSESIDMIFQHFTKIEDDESGFTKGIGLGLAISHSIAEALGGRVSVESVIGKGSTFTFSIPMKTVLTENDVVVKELKEPVLESWKGKTIMIAEDVDANFLYLSKILQKTRAEIIWAKNGEEAIEMAFDNKKIDLILMDLKMPGIDGSEVARRIKKHNPEQIIVAQTAYARPQEKQKFYDDNFDEYISKPIDPADLIMILAKFL